jgi:hypothetical protein
LSAAAIELSSQPLPNPRGGSFSLAVKPFRPEVALLMQGLLSTALELHQTGQLGPAAQLYLIILSQEQENGDALHLPGVLDLGQADKTLLHAYFKR